MRLSSLLRLPIGAFCLLVGLATGLSAQEAAAVKPTEQDCQKATAQSEMRICENARYQAAQGELKTTYQAALRHLDNSQKAKLRQAQHAWIRFRDLNAAFQAGLVEGGTLAPLVKVANLTEMTNARTAELKKVVTQ